MAELASQPTSIQSVYGWFRENKLFVNRRYQRKLVWTLDEKQKLIGSILNKYPIPAILLAETEDKPGTYEIIDGLQRLHAIMSFIETSFAMNDGRVFNLDYFPTASLNLKAGKFVLNFSDNMLSQREVSTILDYSLALSVMRNASDAEINDVFGRINTYGHRLSDQERRQAGIENEFSSLVRQVACQMRGDVSQDIIALDLMPSISIDLPKTKHGYQVQADEVFWVNQGIIRSTDLRDSIDEQCIADIAARILGGKMIERSKDALDEIYIQGSNESERLLNGLEVYGRSKFIDEFAYCVDVIAKVCATGKPEKLRDIVFKQRTTNAFPSVFAVILLAFYELIVKEGKSVADLNGVKASLRDSSERIETTRRATAADERRRNVDTIKGLISPSFVSVRVENDEIYRNHTIIDIEALIRRSEIEISNYELKQGLLALKVQNNPKIGSIDKILQTVCAMANIGPSSTGKIVLGVTDKKQDAQRVKTIDSVDAHQIGGRYVVGIKREAERLSISVEEYFAKLRDLIKSSSLSVGLRDQVLSNLDYHNFYGLGIIVITVPSQTEVSYLGDEIFWRNGDSTEAAIGAKQIAAIARRF